MTIKKQPQIRFGGFGGDWVEIPITEILCVRKETADSDLYDLDVELENLVSNSGILIGDTSVRTQTNSLFKQGDILFGRLRPYLNKWWLANQDGVKSGEIWALETNPNYSNLFTYRLIQSEKFLQIANVTSGTKMPRADWKNVAKISFRLPEKPEQIAIGQFFRQLDEMLTLAEQKHAQTVQLKKAMLGKLFPISGSLQPQIRLKGFSGDWVERKFGDLADVQRGLTYSPNNICENGIRVLRSSNINEDTYLEHQNDVFIDKNAVNIPLVQDNDILITSANGSSRLVGKHAIIKLGNTPAVHGGFMLLARTNQPFFLNASMSSDWYSKFINTYVAGGNGAIGNLSRSDLVEQIILVPETIAEQTAIGKLFQTLDHTIALQAKEINQIKQLKSALLGKMFV